MKFPTPRLLLEIKVKEIWKAKKIFCDYKTARDLLNDLPKLAETYKLELDDLRVKNLLSDQAIADAKQAVYENQKRRKT